MIRKFAFFLLAGFLALSVTAGAAEEEGHHGASDANKPHDTAWVHDKVKTCFACHGEGGVSKVAMFPIIAGQYQDYLAHALKQYRDGERSNPIMKAQAKDLSDAQIDALAAYFSAQPSPLHIP